MSIHLEQMLNDADLKIKENKIDEAVRMLNEILREDPLFGKAHNHLGFIYETKIKDYKQAEEHYKIAYQTMPDYTAIYYNYAILLSTLKKFDELTELLTRAESVPGINKSTINNEWAIMFEANGELDKAIEYYKKTIATTFDNKTLDIAMASVDRCKRKKNFIEGKTDLPPNNNPGGPMPPGM